MIIAFIGPDGSGKTTASMKLLELADECGYRTKYRHLYHYFFLRKAYKMMGNSRVKKAKAEVRAGSRPNWRSVWIFLVWLDCLMSYLLYSIFRRHWVIVFDRYPYDLCISLSGGTVDTFLRFLLKGFPRPMITIALLSTPHLLSERRKDSDSYDDEFCRKAVARYMILANRLHIPIVSTDVSPGKTQKRILSIILSNKKFRSSFVKKCVANRILFHLVESYQLYKFSSYFREIMNIFYTRRRDFLRTLNLVDSALSSINISWAVKDYTFERVPENDVDLMVNTDDLEFATKALAKIRTPIRLHIMGGLEIFQSDHKSVSDGFSQKLGIRFSIYNTLKNGFVRRSEIPPYSARAAGLEGTLGRYLKKVVECRKSYSFPHFIPIAIYFEALTETGMKKLHILRMVLAALISHFGFSLFQVMIFHRSDFYAGSWLAVYKKLRHNYLYKVLSKYLSRPGVQSLTTKL